MKSKIFKDDSSSSLIKDELDKTEKERSIRSVEIIAPKVKIGHATLSKAKKIEKVAKGYVDKDGKKHLPKPYIAEKWELGKRGDSSVDAVYEKAKIIKRKIEIIKNKYDKLD